MSNRILVIEDNEDNRQIIRDLLTSLSCDLIEAVDGVRGWRWRKAIGPT